MRTPRRIVLVEDSLNDIDLTGANAYVVKPADFRKFSEAVKQIAVFWAVVNETPLPGSFE